MSNTQELRDRNGRLLGKISQSGNKQELRDAIGKLKGYYNVQTNETRDSIGRLVGKGNLLSSLLS